MTLAGQYRQRFIPTCVGNTVQVLGDGVVGPVHPHVRGEHLATSAIARSPGGSSPRAWGTPDRAVLHAGKGRFIPTCVGNTLPMAAVRAALPVHPHVRGEHNPPSRCRRRQGGSSPRAWGTHHEPDDLRPQLRFIPTCVGNTRSRSSCPAPIAVHPHVRGEHSRGTTACRNGNGSSPRAWGTRPNRPRNEAGLRFIPTCVGNTRRMADATRGLSVHPHVRGEHGPLISPRLPHSGSSPRAWGTRAGCGWPRRGRRFIPTCVGNTPAPAAAQRRTSVHPHVRGEHCL